MAKKRRTRPVKNPDLIGAGKKESVSQILERGERTIEKRIEEIKMSKMKQQAQASQAAPKPNPSKGKTPSAPGR